MVLGLGADQMGRLVKDLAESWWKMVVLQAPWIC